jgi:hypothetical protein
MTPAWQLFTDVNTTVVALFQGALLVTWRMIRDDKRRHDGS